MACGMQTWSICVRAHAQRFPYAPHNGLDPLGLAVALGDQERVTWMVKQCGAPLDVSGWLGAVGGASVSWAVAGLIGWLVGAQ